MPPPSSKPLTSLSSHFTADQISWIRALMTSQAAVAPFTDAGNLELFAKTDLLYFAHSSTEKEVAGLLPHTVDAFRQRR